MKIAYMWKVSKIGFYFIRNELCVLLMVGHDVIDFIEVKTKFKLKEGAFLNLM